jgi:AcrR family transcriptional regulator
MVRRLIMVGAARRAASAQSVCVFRRRRHKLNACLVYVNSAMSPRPKKADDADVFAAVVRAMQRRGPAQLTLRAIAAEAGVTAGALVQRFGSKRALLRAHARYAAATGDIGFGPPAPEPGHSPLAEVRAAVAVYAALAASPAAAVRNLAYLLNDLSDPVLRRHLVRGTRATRARYETLLAQAIDAGELRHGTDAKALARLLEATLGGSVLAWTLHREGAAAQWLRQDLDALLAPYLTRTASRRACR